MPYPDDTNDWADNFINQNVSRSPDRQPTIPASRDSHQWKVSQCQNGMFILGGESVGRPFGLSEQVANYIAQVALRPLINFNRCLHEPGTTPWQWTPRPKLSSILRVRCAPGDPRVRAVLLPTIPLRDGRPTATFARIAPVPRDPGRGNREGCSRHSSCIEL